MDFLFSVILCALCGKDLDHNNLLPSELSRNL